MGDNLINPVLFEQLKTNMESDDAIRQELSKIVDELEKNISFAQGILSRVHSTPRKDYPEFLAKVEEAVNKEIDTVGQLAKVASQYPYYKFNFKWSSKLQDAISTALLCAWLGGMGSTTTTAASQPAQLGRLLTIEETGALFAVPVNLKDRDAFHITIEEYLSALVGLTNELSRLAMNSVTLGDNEMAVLISAFIKDVYAGFQLLNLKNDFLRKRVDGVKYSVKRVEDVIYDLSLRNLLPAKKSAAESA